ncbi:MAG: efflux RND transporter periplasmic adaptor subunit [Planctomycetaceae bacterium]|nr:efflux RND transporter periplasmic adaptor subunit [Planctomycetaceae bacterium]
MTIRVSLICFLMTFVSSIRADGITLRYEAFTEPYRTIDVAAAEPGRIAQVHIRRGSRVREGDLLVELDSSVLEASQKAAARRVANTARLEALKVDHQLKQRRYETLLALSREGAGTAEELLTSESEARIAELQIEAAREELEQAQLELAEIEARIEQRRIRAYFDGIVTEVRKDPGEFVSAVEPEVATIVDLSRLRITFYLPTSRVEPLEEGQGCKLTLVDGSRGFAGTVEYVGPLTQADSGRVRVDIVIENGNQDLRSGMRCLLIDDRPHQLTNRVN